MYLAKMLHVSHTRQHGEHSVGRSGEAECPRRHALLRLTLLHLGNDVVGNVGQTAAEQRFHDYRRDAAFLQFAVQIDGICIAVVDFVGVVPVEIVKLYLHEVPVVAALVVPFEQHVVYFHVAVIREADVAYAPLALLFHEPVEYAVVHIAAVEHAERVLPLPD